MGIVRLILSDQLSSCLSSLHHLNPKKDTLLLIEAMEEATYVEHHPKKIAFLFSAMRHFADELEAKGLQVHYVRLDDPENSGSLTGEIKRACKILKPESLVVTEPSEWRLLDMIRSWKTFLGIPIEIRPDDRFLCTHEEFSRWAQGKRQLRMEFFYREMRKKYGILLDKSGKPEGGEWNYDKQNRKPPASGMKSPSRIRHQKSPLTLAVLKLTKERFSHHFGTLEPFHYAVTRDQALKELEHFMSELLPHFGDYQDAMVAGEPYLYHSLLSSYLNAGLLLPLEICQKAELKYREGKAPLNAVEGFIRQILGWREYIRGIYWHFMPEYGNRNALNANRPLPNFYWTAETKMFCMSEAIQHTRDHAYSHHIQRLMVTGNFALLAGLDVKAVQIWYLSVYSDAYEWVEMPNTLGMSLFGDGGIVASKPYAASGKYIQRMSNYCKKCAYNPEELTGETACPFNSLYWQFLATHEAQFRSNPRMSYMFATWDKFTLEKKAAVQAQATLMLKKMSEGEL
jgi:deoxyribodipyrimidine photolyase-related protein